MDRGSLRADVMVWGGGMKKTDHLIEYFYLAIQLGEEGGRGELEDGFCFERRGVLSYCSESRKWRVGGG